MSLLSGQTFSLILLRNGGHCNLLVRRHSIFRLLSEGGDRRSPPLKREGLALLPLGPVGRSFKRRPASLALSQVPRFFRFTTARTSVRPPMFGGPPRRISRGLRALPLRSDALAGKCMESPRAVYRIGRPHLL